MKKNILLTILCCSFMLAITAQTPEAKSKDSIAKVESALKKSKDDSIKAVKEKRILDSIAEANKKAKLTKTVCDTCNYKVSLPITIPTGGGAWALVFMPLILFVGILAFLFFAIRKLDFKEALSENEFVKKTIKNEAYSATAIKDIASTAAAASISSILPPTIEITEDVSSTTPPTPGRISSSRFIALITSLLTLIISACMASFYIYFYLASGTAPDISKFSTVLLALGIGVVPYAFNKLATAIGNSKPSADN